MGLQFGWRSYYWISALPPIVIIAIFKAYITRTFSAPSRYYIPTEAELRDAKVHSERSDNRGGRLSRRFGHPALHAELFTPMVHANMVPLLAQVFSGKIGSSTTKMSEMGGQKMDTAVVQGGIKIAGIEEVRLVPCSRDRVMDINQSARSRATWATTRRSTNATEAKQTGTRARLRRISTPTLPPLPRQSLCFTRTGGLPRRLRFPRATWIGT